MRRGLGIGIMMGLLLSTSLASAEPSITAVRYVDGGHGASLHITVTDPPPNAGQAVRLYHQGENKVLKSATFNLDRMPNAWMAYPPVGVYELRLLDKDAQVVLVRSAPITVSYVHWDTELDAVDTTVPRAHVSVTITGTIPDTAKDYVGLYKVIEGAKTGEGHVASRFWAAANPMVFEMPLQPGSYEFRLLEKGTYYIIAAHPIIVE